MPRGEGGISEALLGPNVKRLPYSFLFKMSVSGEKSTDRRDRQDREVKSSSREQSIEELQFKRTVTTVLLSLCLSIHVQIILTEKPHNY